MNKNLPSTKAVFYENRENNDIFDLNQIDLIRCDIQMKNTEILLTKLGLNFEKLN